MTLLSDLAVAQADRDKAWAAYLRSAEKAHVIRPDDDVHDHLLATGILLLATGILDSN